MLFRSVSQSRYIYMFINPSRYRRLNNFSSSILHYLVSIIIFTIIESSSLIYTLWKTPFNIGHFLSSLSLYSLVLFYSNSAAGPRFVCFSLNNLILFVQFKVLELMMCLFELFVVRFLLQRVQQLCLLKHAFLFVELNRRIHILMLLCV